MKDRECVKCKWFVPVQDSDQCFGECHRMPPTVMMEHSEEDGVILQVGTFPIVQSNDFCGEFASFFAGPEPSSN